ncbi:MAG: gamma-glutamylcyclotransferase [Deltaproteobacteria bacterium]|jgi:gamma-glutamylcyclotransferase (GGCT)/AIG2-like uncharacterized protein YtfP|nr:gamma-glutamylcyclotransferase [Deltaproteobacteria bacterium]
MTSRRLGTVDRNHDRLFVYGALLDAQLRARLLGRELRSEPALLSGYQRGRKRYFFVTPHAGAGVPGEILSELRPDDFALLDRYEAVPRLYTRERGQVQNATGERVECWIYLPTGWEKR